MQIQGAREFFSNLAALSKSAAGARGGSFSPGASPLQMFLSDTLNISDIGKRLSLGVDKAPNLNETQKAGISTPFQLLVDKYMAQAEEILTRMHELATTAQDEKLSDLDRINMQIEFEELRHKLSLTQENFVEQSQNDGSPLLKRSRKFDLRPQDPFTAGDGTNLLQRMRNRIVNGEKWNVREVFVRDDMWELGNTVRNKMSGLTYHSKEGWSFTEGDSFTGNPVSGKRDHAFSDALRLVDGQFVAAGEWRVIDDSINIVPTAREVLEQNSPVVLMDAKSAVEGAELIQRELETVKKLRAEYRTSPEPEEAFKAASYFLFNGLSLGTHEVMGLDALFNIDDDGRIYRVTDSMWRNDFITLDLTESFSRQAAESPADNSFGAVELISADGINGEIERPFVRNTREVEYTLMLHQEMKTQRLLTEETALFDLKLYDLKNVAAAYDIIAGRLKEENHVGSQDHYPKGFAHEIQSLNNAFANVARVIYAANAEFDYRNNNSIVFDSQNPNMDAITQAWEGRLNMVIADAEEQAEVFTDAFLNNYRKFGLEIAFNMALSSLDSYETTYMLPTPYALAS